MSTIRLITYCEVRTSLEDDLQKAINEERQQIDVNVHLYRPFNLSKFESYGQIVDSIEFYADQSSYKRHIKSFVLGKSFEGRDIVGIEIGNMGEPVIFIECGIHAREWASTSTCLYIIDELITKHDLHQDLLER